MPHVNMLTMSIYKHHLGSSCELELHDDLALLALQGPKAAKVLSGLAPAVEEMTFMTASR